MLPIHKIIWHELRAKVRPARVPEPCEAMENEAQIRSYVKAYDWGGPFSALQLHHLRELSKLIRPGDTVLDLACGPGPLLLELAPLYPDCTFIGADLSRSMLDALRATATERGIRNLELLHEDIRLLPSLQGRRVDLVITTLALHHLPNEEDLRATLRKIGELLQHGAALYVFDFGLLRSSKTRALLIAESAKTAPPITVVDYEQSLRAAFEIDFVLRAASEILKTPFRASSSSFVDFYYFLQTEARTEPSAQVRKQISRLWKKLSVNNKIEYLMLQLLRRSRRRLKPAPG